MKRNTLITFVFLLLSLNPALLSTTTPESFGGASSSENVVEKDKVADSHPDRDEEKKTEPEKPSLKELLKLYLGAALIALPFGLHWYATRTGIEALIWTFNKTHTLDLADLPYKLPETEIIYRVEIKDMDTWIKHEKQKTAATKAKLESVAQQVVAFLDKHIEFYKEIPRAYRQLK